MRSDFSALVSVGTCPFVVVIIAIAINPRCHIAVVTLPSLVRRDGLAGVRLGQFRKLVGHGRDTLEMGYLEPPRIGYVHVR